jgi:hypothetical protein
MCESISSNDAIFCNECGYSFDSEFKFEPIKKTSLEIYKICISRLMWRFISFVYILFIVSEVLSTIVFSNYDLKLIPHNLYENFIPFLAAALQYFWIIPSGIRRVYNKSKGSKRASRLAVFLVTFFGVIGWIICWLYEKY